MATAIKMPPLSQTTDTVTLTDWLVKEGDEIKKGQPIADVETDKVTMQVESFTAGTVLQRVCPAGTEVPVGDIIAYVGEAGEEVPSTGPAGASPGQGAESEKIAVSEKRAAAGTAGNKTVKATPLVQNFAEKRGVDLSAVAGSGPKGLIVKADVVKFLEQGGRGSTAAEADVSVQAVDVRKVSGAAEQAGGMLTGVEFSERRLSRNQQAVARNLVKSVQEIPQYYLKSTVYLDAALKWRENNTKGKKVSIYSLYVYAAAKALKTFAGINGYFYEGNQYVYRDVNIGFALAHGHDLFVPVIKQAERKSVEEIDQEVRWLTAKTQNGKLEPDDIIGGTFTVSNLGVYPIDEFSAIISPGQAAVLAIGRSRKQLVVDDYDRMSVRQCAAITGSFDHRIVNGAEGAAFMERMKGILEKEI